MKAVFQIQNRPDFEFPLPLQNFAYPREGVGIKPSDTIEVPVVDHKAPLTLYLFRNHKRWTTPFGKTSLYKVLVQKFIDDIDTTLPPFAGHLIKPLIFRGRSWDQMNGGLTIRPSAWEIPVQMGGKDRVRIFKQQPLFSSLRLRRNDRVGRTNNPLTLTLKFWM